MPEPDNLVLVLLREMRAEMNERFHQVRADMTQGFDENKARFDRLEKRLEAVRQAAFGESLMARFAVAEVDDRLQNIEKRLAALEGSRG
jgi:tetrahydromethanopterin S-methyltransferase subunit G